MHLGRRPCIFVIFAIFANFAISVTSEGTKYATASGGLHLHHTLYRGFAPGLRFGTSVSQTP